MRGAKTVVFTRLFWFLGTRISGFAKRTARGATIISNYCQSLMDYRREHPCRMGAQNWKRLAQI